MTKPAVERCLARVSKICLAFPEATCEIAGDHAIYRIRKKPFAYFLNNHHGDGIVSISAKVARGDNAALIASQPARFYPPAYIFSRGWVALHLDAGEIEWAEVRELISDSYRRIAPKTLAAMVKIEDE